VFLALSGIPVRPVHGSDRGTYGLCIGLIILRPFLCSHRASTHSLTDSYPHPRQFHDAGSEAHHVCMGRGLAFRLGGTRECCSARARCGDGYGPLRRERNLNVLVQVNSHARSHTLTRAHTYAHGHTRDHTHTHAQGHNTHAHALTHTHTHITVTRSDPHRYISRCMHLPGVQPRSPSDRK
jgi:hypothetical protein